MSDADTSRPDGTKSRLHRRIEAARSLAADLADQGQPRMAQIIRDLCNSAMGSANLNSRLSSEIMALRNGEKV